MSDQVPLALRQRLQTKLKVTPRQVYRLIAKIGQDQLVSPRAAAFLLAREHKISFSMYADASDLAEMRGHPVAASKSAAPAVAARATSPPVFRKAISTKKNNSVFVVHGRDAALNEDMFALLRSLGINAMEWSKAIAAAKGANPNVGDVIDNAMKEVQGVIVMFSPDEEARLKKRLRTGKDSATLEGQARLNVIFEAGLALGAHPKKTLLVQVGDTRPISDIAGKHILRLSNSGPSRKELAQRLKKMGFRVDLDGTSWMTEGNFDR